MKAHLDFAAKMLSVVSNGNSTTSKTPEKNNVGASTHIPIQTCKTATSMVTSSPPPIHPPAQNLSCTKTPAQIQTCTPSSVQTITVSSKSTPIHPPAWTLSCTSTPAPIHTCTPASVHTRTLTSNPTPVQSSPALNLSNAASGPVEPIPFQHTTKHDNNNCLQQNASFNAFNCTFFF